MIRPSRLYLSKSLGQFLKGLPEQDDDDELFNWQQFKIDAASSEEDSPKITPDEPSSCEKSVTFGDWTSSGKWPSKDPLDKVLDGSPSIGTRKPPSSVPLGTDKTAIICSARDSNNLDESSPTTLTVFPRCELRLELDDSDDEGDYSLPPPRLPSTVDSASEDGLNESAVGGPARIPSFEFPPVLGDNEGRQAQGASMKKLASQNEETNSQSGLLCQRGLTSYLYRPFESIQGMWKRAGPGAEASKKPSLPVFKDKPPLSGTMTNSTPEQQWAESSEKSGGTFTLNDRSSSTPPQIGLCSPVGLRVLSHLPPTCIHKVDEVTNSESVPIQEVNLPLPSSQQPPTQSLDNCPRTALSTPLGTMPSPQGPLHDDKGYRLKNHQSIGLRRPKRKRSGLEVAYKCFGVKCRKMESARDGIET